jgi:hypothetical protein
MKPADRHKGGWKLASAACNSAVTPSPSLYCIISPGPTVSSNCDTVEGSLLSHSHCEWKTKA